MFVYTLFLSLITLLTKTLATDSPSTYYECINELVIGNINYTTMANAHIDLKFTHEYALLNEINMVSFDKGLLIADIKNFHDYALEGGQWGDAAILELVISYNAQPMDYVNNVEVQRDAAEFARFNTTLLNILAESTTNPSIAEFFKGSVAIAEKLQN